MKSYGLDNQEYFYELTTQEEAALKHFFVQEKLNEKQAGQFRTYLIELIIWNKKFNITALDTVSDIIAYHFQDSLKVRDFIPLQNSRGIADVGSGGGFPGLPLAILFPDLPVVLIEVNTKKIEFLEHIKVLLELHNVTVSPFDWRTFLRKTEYPIDFFCARASLDPEELVRIFKPGCFYNYAQLIYWASSGWHGGEPEKPFLKTEIPYKIGERSRKFVVFSAKNH
ncbi:MAG: 16S rRNA (guanine(527)-N(7))-methyltransferase RsmG [Candidatus Babeliales bacterium]